MSSPVGHALVGIAVYISATGKKRLSLKEIAGLFILSNIPDVDYPLSLTFPSLFGERHTYTHSLGILLFSAVLILIYLKFNHKWLCYFSGQTFKKCTFIVISVIASHLLLDLFTEDGSIPRGLMLFWPISYAYYISPWEILPGIAHGSYEELLSLQNLRTVLIEVFIFVPVCWLFAKKFGGKITA